MNETVPDETTLRRFRNQLIRLGLLEELLGVVNTQLESDGLKVRKSRGAVVDATVIESATRPRRTVDVEAVVDRQEEEVQTSSSSVAIEESKDSDARWLKKGKKYFFGYKGFIRTDVEDGYIEAVKMTPANQVEVNKLEDLMGENQGRRVYADKTHEPISPLNTGAETETFAGRIFFNSTTTSSRKGMMAVLWFFVVAALAFKCDCKPSRFRSPHCRASISPRRRPVSRAVR